MYTVHMLKYVNLEPLKLFYAASEACDRFYTLFLNLLAFL